jgi:acyl-CoA dehydrogenase
MGKVNTALSFSDEQSMLLESARDFCADKSPVSKVRELMQDERGYDPTVWQEMSQLGWLGIAIPEQYGGSELGIGSVVPVAEAAGRNMLATPLITSTLAAQVILRGGDNAQKEQWLPQLAEGKVASMALIEGEDWGDDNIQCAVTAEGGKLTLHGEKWYVPYADSAELFVVLVQNSGQPAFALVPREQVSNAAITPHVLIDETQRASKIDFSGVVIDQESLINGSNAAVVLRDIRLIGAMLFAAEATGSTAACLDIVVEYLQTRKQFGKLIGSYQGLKHPTVEILTAMDSARSHCYHAATVVGAETLDEDAEIACRMAKAQATDALCFAGDRAIQFHGGMGFTYECDAMLYMRRAQWAQPCFGDAYHHRKRLAPLLLD